MRLILFFFVLILSFGCGNTKHASTDSNQLTGSWVPIREEMSGKQWPASIYEKQKLIISGKSYTLIAESVDKGEVKYNAGKMDIYGKEGVNAGKHFTAIYKFEKGELSICYNLAGDNYPESFETKNGSLLFLAVFKRVAH